MTARRWPDRAPNMQPPPTRDGGAFSFPATMDCELPPATFPATERHVHLRDQSAGLVKTCPGLRSCPFRSVMRSYPVAARSTTANNMRALVCPFHPAVHESRGRKPRDQATPGRVIRRLRTVSRIGDLAPSGAVAGA